MLTHTHSIRFAALHTHTYTHTHTCPYWAAGPSLRFSAFQTWAWRMLLLVNVCMARRSQDLSSAQSWDVSMGVCMYAQSRYVYDMKTHVCSVSMGLMMWIRACMCECEYVCVRMYDKLFAVPWSDPGLVTWVLLHLCAHLHMAVLRSVWREMHSMHITYMYIYIYVHTHIHRYM